MSWRVPQKEHERVSETGVFSSLDLVSGTLRLSHYVTEISHLYSLRDFWRHFGLCRAAAHSGCCFFALCTNIFTYLLTYFCYMTSITSLWSSRVISRVSSIGLRRHAWNDSVISSRDKSWSGRRPKILNTAGLVFTTCSIINKSDNIAGYSFIYFANAALFSSKSVADL